MERTPSSFNKVSLASRLYARLPTERTNPASRGLDKLDTLSIVRLINRQDQDVAPAVGRQAGHLARAADMIAFALSRGGRLFIIGAGTSGRLGVLEAAECPPTFGTAPGMIRAIMAGGRMAVFRSKEGAEDDAAAGARAARLLARGDVLVGVAASGITPFVKAALAQARRRGCATVLITSNHQPQGNPALVTIAPRVGPEVLAGSTRMKSGTAAKLALNTLTTAAMIKLGKAYDHWMVDLKPSSRKLRLRALRIVCELGRVPPAKAQSLLSRAGGRVKLAVLMARTGLAPSAGRKILAQAGGSLRRALDRGRRF